MIWKRRLTLGDVLQRDVALAGGLVVQHRVAMEERAAAASWPVKRMA